MGFRSSDVVPISEARARSTELAQDVVDGGPEKVLTTNGANCGAIVLVKKLDCYLLVEEEYAGLVLLGESAHALRQIVAGERIADADLIKALAD